MQYALLIFGAVVCAILSIRSTRLLISSLWLAGVSILVAITLYIFGAHEIAVIELSVGAGLVTVLFVFAIGIAGDEPVRSRSQIPRPLAWGLVSLTFLLLIYSALSLTETRVPSAEPPLEIVFWEARALDVLVQIVIIFSGVLGILGLLAEPKSHTVPTLIASRPESLDIDTPTQPIASNIEQEIEKELT